MNFRTLSLFAAALLPLAVACAAPAGDESTSDDSSAEDALTTSGNGYFVNAGRGVTGGTLVKLAGQKKTTLVLGLKLDGLKLSDAEEKLVADAFDKGEAVVKGKLVTTTTRDPIATKITRLEVSEAWVGKSRVDDAELGQFMLVQPSMVMCAMDTQEDKIIGMNCPIYRSTVLNGKNATSMESHFDVKEDLSTTEKSAAGRLALSANGLVVWGFPQGVARGPMSIEASHVFFPITAGSGAKSDCANAGAKCVALVPGACKAGKSLDARFFSCGGGLGVQCCAE